jgi:type II secretory pathway pseudopilin PulG
MSHLKRYFTSIALLSALAVPVALSAQDRDHDDHDRDNNHRVYDRQYRDYHNWNNDENGRYRQWYGSQYSGRSYRDYNKLSRKQQNDYWKWRHKNNDHDDHDRH